MALPKLNSNPSYEVTIPSTGKKVYFRPFLVKEQKNLLIALETQDRKDLLRAIVKTIEACVEEKITSPLTTYDVDYLFTTIRAKSVGEQTELVFQCDNCEHKNKVVVELDKLQIANLDLSNMVAISDTITVKMRPPTYEEFLGSESLAKSTTQSQLVFELILLCMESVHTEEELISIQDETREDIVHFIESMTAAQYEKLANYIGNVPYVYKDLEFVCSECGTENKRTLQGMDDFF